MPIRLDKRNVVRVDSIGVVSNGKRGTFQIIQKVMSGYLKRYIKKNLKWAAEYFNPGIACGATKRQRID